ncbi:MAG: hypothetical protein JXJ19_08895 [Elusimicrobia bacterium]|nr:hypothetical protein [Elusimicrobiota bacterium]
MAKRGETVLRNITLERHNATIMRLLSQHNEEVQRLKDRITELEREKRNEKRLLVASR